MSLQGETTERTHSLLDLLPPDARASLISSCEGLAFKFGDVVMREGQPADAMFIIVSGRARVVQRTDAGDEVVLASLGAGEVLGETGLLQGGIRTATVRASSELNVMRLGRAEFESLRASHPAVQGWLEQCTHARLLFSFLRRAGAFSRLPVPVIRDLVSMLEPVEVPLGQTLIKQGDPPGPMFLIQEGRLRVSQTTERGAKALAYLREGDVAGEVSLLKEQPRNATIEALTDCKALALSIKAFHRLEERWPEFRHAVEERVATYDYEHEARLPLDFAREILPTQAPETVPGAMEVSAEEAEERAAPQVEEVAPEAEARPWHHRLLHAVRAKGRFPFIRQVDEADCGVACLAMIARFHGKRVPLARLHALAHTATDGTTLRNLCFAAEELGFTARPLRVSKANVDKLPAPAIIHWKGNHWVVLVEVGRQHVRIADPGIGVKWVTRAEFDEAWTGYAAVMTPAEGFTTAGTDGGASWSWITDYVRPHVPTLLKALGLAIIGSVLTMALPVLTQVVIDRIVVGGAADALTMVLIALVATFAIRTISAILQGHLLAFVALRLDASILDYLSRRLLALPVTYFMARRTADIQRRLDGARQLRQMALSSGVAGGLALIQIVMAMVLMTVYSAKLTMLFLVVMPFYAALMFLSGRYLHRLYAELEHSQAEYRAEQLDAIKGIHSVKASAAEHKFREGLIERFLRMAQLQSRTDVAVLGYRAGVEAAGFLTSIVFLWRGAHLTLDGELTLGSYVAFSSLVALAVGPLGIFLATWDNLQIGKVLVARLQDVLVAEPEQGKDRGRLLPVQTLSGALELRNVSFRYGGPDSTPILKGITLKVPAGRTVAIVGRSGSGKSTLIKLLTGLIEPTDGTILFDGIELRTLNYRDLRRQVGYVLQETHLFSGTVAENISLGTDHVLERVVAAARAANAHEFIERMPLGYETRIGESGLALSGGQAQRVAIARALYRNPALLIFDEATSALDAESERAILENMHALFEGRTVFVIAHRLSTVRNADWTIVLERGEIVEQGTHDDLMERRGLYFYLVSRQVES
jgi:ATP-binding cassette subfamily B protein